MDKYQERIIGMIRDADFFFDAVQTAGNEAMRNANSNIGLGHIMRCLSIADALSSITTEPTIVRGKNRRILLCVLL